MSWLALAALTLFLAVFLVGPLAAVLVEGLHPAYLAEAFLNPVYRAGLGNSLAIAAVTTAITMTFTVPLAWLGARVRFRGKALCEAMLLAPLILPPFVGALGVFQVLGQFGVLNSLLAALGVIDPGGGPDWLGDHRFAIVCVVEALGLYPVLYLLLRASFARIDPATLEAASSLGASRLTVFRRVVLPLARPGLFGGGVIVFVWSFTELGTPLLLNFDRVTPVQIFNGLSELSTNRMPFALVVVMLTVASALYALSRLAFAGRYDAMAGRGAGAGGLESAAVLLRGRRAALAALPFLAVAGASLLPHLAVVLIGVSGDWYRTVLPTTLTLAHAEEALSHPLVVPGIINSVTYSAAATLLGVSIGLFIAWIATRWRPRGWQAFDLAAMAPLAVPGLVFAFGYIAIGHQLGAWFPRIKPIIDPMQNPSLMLIIAYAVRRLPHVVRAASAGLAQAPVVYEEAAAALGASRFTRLRRITLPLIAASVAAGALMTFSFSMLEVSDSLILAQKRDFWPITRVIYDLVGVLGTGPAIACAFATWAMLFLAATLAAAAVFLGKGPGAMFRE